MLSPGDRLRVKVIGIDAPEGAKQPKIGLSIKQLEEDPWMSVDQRVKDGDVVRGNVDSLVKLVRALRGAGVELIDEGAASAAGGRGVRLIGRPA